MPARRDDIRSPKKVQWDGRPGDADAGRRSDGSMVEEPTRWDPEDYARHSGAQLAWAEGLIGKLHLRGAERVLDIGSGDGKVTALLARKVPRGWVVGIDASAEMVAAARLRFPPSRYGNIRFLLLDAASIDLEERFDIAFSNATLHWVKDQSAVLRGVRRCLEPAGRILFQMGGKGNARELVEILDELIVRDPWKPHFEDFEFPYAFLGPEEYRTLLEAEDFRPIRVELIPKAMRRAGKDDLASWIRTTWMPYTGRVPEERRGRFIAEVVDAYARRRPPDPLGNLTVDMVRLEVEAVKPS